MAAWPGTPSIPLSRIESSPKGRSVPVFGAIISAIPAILLALSVSPGKALVVAAVYLAIQQVDAHVVSPLVIGRSVSLHPALSAFGVVIVGALFGFVGLLVAVPVISLAAVLVEELWMSPLEENRWGVAAEPELSYGPRSGGLAS